jgi:hypothetical protein
LTLLACVSQARPALSLTSDWLNGVSNRSPMFQCQKPEILVQVSAAVQAQMMRACTGLSGRKAPGLTEWLSDVMSSS